MANQSTLLTSALLLMSNSTDFDQSSIGSDIDDHIRYVIERFRLAFVVLGIALGVTAIGFNTAIVISSLVVKTPWLLRFSSQTINLMASLAVADLFLLVFGTDCIPRIELISSPLFNNSALVIILIYFYFIFGSGLPYDLVAAHDDNPWPRWLEGRIGCPMSAYLPEA